jgi:ribonuclease P protein component
VVLPQRHRLRGHRVFERIYRQAQRHHSPFLVLRVLPADEGLLSASQRRFPVGDWRCGVVVSGKVSKRAVHRNRLRRDLHAHLLSDPPRVRRPTWLLISVKPGGMETPRHQLLGECSLLLRKAGLSHDGHDRS